MLCKRNCRTILVSLGVCSSCKIFGELPDHLEGIGKHLVYNKIVVVFLGYIINIFFLTNCPSTVIEEAQ